MLFYSDTIEAVKRTIISYFNTYDFNINLVPTNRHFDLRNKNGRFVTVKISKCVNGSYFTEVYFK